MRATHRILLFVLVVGNVGLAEPPAVPETPAPVLDLVLAQPFVLEQDYHHDWRLERPTVKSGYLLVLRVDGNLVYPRQVPEPVLYVGRQTAERVNVGYRSGHVVAIVPANIDDPSDPDYIDLREARMFFGTPAMPERVDAEMIAWEHRRAVEAGIEPFDFARVQAARRLGGRHVSLVGKMALLRAAMTEVAVYSPQERDLVDGVLAAKELETIPAESPEVPSRTGSGAVHRNQR